MDPTPAARFETPRLVILFNAAAGAVSLLCSGLALLLSGKDRGFIPIAAVLAFLFLSAWALLRSGRPWPIAVARLIHLVLLGAYLDLVPLYLLLLVSPFAWLLLAMAAPIMLALAIGSIVTLGLTSRTPAQRVAVFVGPVVFAVLIPAAAFVAYGSSFLAARAWVWTRYRGSPVADAERAGSWAVFREDPGTGEIFAWRRGSFDPRPTFAPNVAGPAAKLEFDVGHRRLAIVHEGRLSVRDLATGSRAFDAALSSVHWRPTCPRFDSVGDLWLADTEGLHRLKAGSSGPGEVEVAGVPESETCPSASADGRLLLFTMPDAIRLMALEGRALRELSRWPKRGRAFLSPDGRFILEFQGREATRRDVASGVASPLATLPLGTEAEDPEPRWRPEWDALWPQTFSPDGRWFLLSSRTAQRCRRSYWALDTEGGSLTPLPLLAPIGQCSDERFQSHAPGTIRWVADSR